MLGFEHQTWFLLTNITSRKKNFLLVEKPNFSAFRRKPRKKNYHPTEYQK